MKFLIQEHELSSMHKELVASSRGFFCLENLGKFDYYLRRRTRLNIPPDNYSREFL